MNLFDEIVKFTARWREAHEMPRIYRPDPGLPKPLRAKSFKVVVLLLDDEGGSHLIMGDAMPDDTSAVLRQQIHADGHCDVTVRVAAS